MSNVPAKGLLTTYFLIKSYSLDQSFQCFSQLTRGLQELIRSFASLNQCRIFADSSLKSHTTYRQSLLIIFINNLINSVMNVKLNFIKMLEPTVKGSKTNKSIKRMSNEQIFDYLCKGVKIPKHLTRDELVQMNCDMLFGTETQLGIGAIQNAVAELLRINLVKVGIHPEDAEEFVDELSDGWQGTDEASDLLFMIFEAVQSKYEKIDKKVA